MTIAHFWRHAADEVPPGSKADFERSMIRQGCLPKLKLLKPSDGQDGEEDISQPLVTL